MGATQVVDERTRWFKIAYSVLAWIFAACVVAQVFFAGLALFHRATYWIQHVSFIHMFEYIPIVILLLLLIGRAPRGKGLYWPQFAILVLILVQYVTAGSSLGSMIAAVHPVSAMVLFWVSTIAIQRGRRWELDHSESASQSRVAVKS